jgi:quercetin dioxygenase-like cupin family protein
MPETTSVETMIAALEVGVTRSARPEGMAKLTPIHRETIGGFAGGTEQEVRVLTAILLPGDETPYHSHRHPVTVYVTEGVFTLALDGREPIQISAGEAFVEPAHSRMTGSNRGDQPAHTILFFVCEPDTPFADPA